MPKNLQKKTAFLDDVDVGILTALAGDGRMSVADLARAAKMSAPSIAERIRRLEDAGVIEGYGVDVDPASLGLSLSALVRIRPMAGQLHRIAGMIKDTPEIVECHRTTGDDCFVAKVHVADVLHLERLIDRFIQHAQTNTSIIQSTPVKRRQPPLKTTATTP